MERGGILLEEHREAAPLLEAEGLCKSYHGVRALAPVSFRLEAGWCLGVTGANGSGKSTLLRLLARAERPDGGRVLFRGRDVGGSRDYPRRHMGYLPQDDQLAEELTGGEQLRLWQAACGRRGGPGAELTELLGLEELLCRRVAAMSGGMRRRVAIAMALSGEPEVLVMDEATVGVDERCRQALLAWMEGFLRRGGCAVWCTHRPDELERLGAARLTLEDGRARWETKKEE